MFGWISMFGACLEVCLNTFWSWDPSKSECVKKDLQNPRKMISSPPKWLALRWNPSKWLDSWSGGFLSSVLCLRCAAGSSWSIGIAVQDSTSDQKNWKLQVAWGKCPVNFFPIHLRNRTAHLWKFFCGKRTSISKASNIRLHWKVTKTVLSAFF